MDVDIYKWEGDTLEKEVVPFDSLRQKLPSYKIGICVPTTSHNHYRFTQDLAMAIASLPDVWEFGLKRKEPISVKTYFNTGSRLHEMRNELVVQAIKDKCTHVMFIDNDMAFPAWAIPMLLNYDLPIIGANCATKTFPSRPTARSFDLKEIYTMPENEGPQQVLQVGTAFLLINTDVFFDMGIPYFDQPYLPEKNYSIGEDVYFCRMAMERGNVPTFICHTVSKEIKHIGEFYYAPQMWWDYKALENADDPELWALYKGCTKHLEVSDDDRNV